MPLNETIKPNEPITEGQPYVFSRNWFRFLDLVARKIKILDGSQSNSATAGTAAALPATPAGYLTILDQDGTPRKVPYYNV